MKKNHRGWIKITESFLAILLVAMVVIAVVSNISVRKTSISSKILVIERSILKEIQLNSSLRNEIINTEGIVEWENFPPLTKGKIQDLTPNFLNCTAKICGPSDLCVLADSESNSENKDIYVDSIMISSTLQKYNPRITKLFCRN